MNAVIRMHSALMQKYPWKTVAFSTGEYLSSRRSTLNYALKSEGLKSHLEICLLYPLF